MVGQGSPAILPAGYHAAVAQKGRDEKVADDRRAHRGVANTEREFDIGEALPETSFVEIVEVEVAVERGGLPADASTTTPRAPNSRPPCMHRRSASTKRWPPCWPLFEGVDGETCEEHDGTGRPCRAAGATGRIHARWSQRVVADDHGPRHNS